MRMLICEASAMASASGAALRLPRRGEASQRTRARYRALVCPSGCSVQSLRQARAEVLDRILQLRQLTVEDALVLGVAGVLDAPADVAGFQLLPLDLRHDLDFRVVHLAHRRPPQGCPNYTIPARPAAMTIR